MRVCMNEMCVVSISGRGLCGRFAPGLGALGPWGRVFTSL